MTSLVITIFSLVILLLSVIIHEVAHGSVAYSMGDPTAKYAGRLTLNPLKHLDPLGSVIVPAILFALGLPIIGWTKPVPVNPYNFRDQKWGQLKVAAVGPLTNFSIAVIFALLIRIISLPVGLETIFSLIAFYNFAWGLFNLIPIPPLDGSHVLFAILPASWRKLEMVLRQYSFVFFILFILFGFQLIFVGAYFLYFFVSGHPLNVF